MSLPINHDISDLYRGDDYVFGVLLYDAPTAQGSWDADANSPDLGASTPDAGDYFVVSVAGSTSLGGVSDWGVGEIAWYDGSTWNRAYLLPEVHGEALDVADLGWEFGAQILSKARHRGGELIGSALWEIDPVVVNKVWFAFPGEVTALVGKSAVWDMEARMPPPSIPAGLSSYTQTIYEGEVVDPQGQATVE